MVHRELWLAGHIVELPEMLAGREMRAQRQRELLEKGGPDYSLISFTINMAGPVKVCATTEIIFNHGLTLINKLLKEKNINILEKKIYEESYGNEGFWLIEADPIEIKTALAKIEETHPLGRLFDIDVICFDGSKVSRQDIGQGQRHCLICGGNAADCAGGRVHTVTEIQNKVIELVIDFEKSINRRDKYLASALAYSSMIAEVDTTPKPGLVDRNNNGSHVDMTPATFEYSALAIKDYFGRCFEAGELGSNLEDPSEMLPEFRRLGLEAEEEMFFATGQVNTHKGLIFCLGFICASLGMAGGVSLDRIFEVAGKIAAPTFYEITASGLSGAGARAQVVGGYPQLREIGIPSYNKAVKMGQGHNKAGIYTLLSLIADVEDTNMIKRGGEEKALLMRKKAREILEEPMNQLIEKTNLLDLEFIDNNLSPGGCADILAMTYFVMMLSDVGIII